ncbi:MAG: DUF6089 family protein [Bacteroidota bacterium]
MMGKLHILTWLLLISSVAYSQSFYAIRRDRSLMVTGGIGTSTYFGELKNPGDYIDAKPNVSAGLQAFFTDRISARAELTWFQLKGSDDIADDPTRVRRNLSFSSSNFELAVTGAINLYPNGNRFYQRAKYNVYAFAGVGVLYFNPKAELNGEKHALQPLMTEGVKYSKFQPVVPYGLGVKMKVGPFFNVALEGAYRLVFTDYLDDVSTVHPDKTGWDATRIALSDRRPELGLTPYATGTQRGNPDKNDGYALFNVKVEYYLANNFLFNPTRKLYTKKRKAYLKRRRR